MFLLRIFGGLFVVIGAIGLFLPLWPTTIFWILAAMCFARSSPAAQAWIYKQPVIGPQVEAFVEHGTLSRASKIAALIGMAIAAAICTVTFYTRPYWLAAAIALILIGAAIVVTRPETKQG
ncbi:MAG: YbaN family protein [Henriciella sp.]